MPLQRRQMPHLLRNLLMPQDDDKTVSDSEEALAADAVDESATAEVPTSAENKSDEVSQLLQKLDEATTQAKTHREDYLRAVAELDNFRKRALREKDEVRLRASSAVLEDFLPVLDNFALGLSAARQHEAGKAFAEGFAMVLNQFESLLRQHGVEEIAPQGEAFDPNLHESVAHMPDPEVPEGHVSQVQRIGYRLRDRLLRPAVVVVSSGPAEAAADQADTSAT